MPTATRTPRTTTAANTTAEVLTPVAATANRQMGPLQKIIARRKVAEHIAEDTGISVRRAIREVDEVLRRATPEQMAAACGCSEDVFSHGVYSEHCVTGVLEATGFPLPVEGFGDGSFLEWLFSDEGRDAILKWVETIVKIISILGPLFI